MSKWYFENKKYALAYITMAEAIVTKVFELEERDIQNYENRENAKESLRNKNKYDIQKLFLSINKIRNNIAHSLDERGMSNYINDINNFNNYYDKLKKFFENNN